MSIPTSMKAVRLHPNSDFSNPYSTTNSAPASALKLDDGLAIPQNLGSDELLVRVEATTIIRDMLTWPESYLHDYPVLGNDFAGTVVEPASDNAAFKAGDQVFGMTDAARAGAWSEYAVVKVDEAYFKPTHLSWTQAAAVPLSGLTAYQALFVHAGIPPPSNLSDTQAAQKLGVAAKSSSVLVTGATGSVGLYLVQLARLAGLHVVAATRTADRNKEFLQKLGANEVVEYDGLFKNAQRYNTIIDTVGGDILKKCWSFVESSGAIISIDSASYDFVAEHKKSGVDGGREDVNAKFFIVSSSQRDLKSLSIALNSRLLEPFVACVLPVADVSRAYELSEIGSIGRGKVVLRFGDEE